MWLQKMDFKEIKADLDGDINHDISMWSCQKVLPCATPWVAGTGFKPTEAHLPGLEACLRCPALNKD